MKRARTASALSLLLIGLLALAGCDTIKLLRYAFANSSSPTLWEGDARVTEVPFRMHGNLMIVALRINGSEPLDFVLDTGAPYPFLLDDPAIRALDLPVVDEIPFGDFDAKVTRYIEIGIGDVRLTEMTAAIMPTDLLPFAAPPKGVITHGILGYEVFRRFVADLDYQRQVITLYDPEIYDYSGVVAPIPLIFDDRKPYAWFDATLPDRGTEAEATVVPVKLHVDTGKTGTLHLDTWSDERIHAPEVGVPIEQRGITGGTHGVLARLPRIQLGDVAARDVIIEYRTADSRGQDKDRNGFLGNEVLRRYHIIFDYAGERMWIEPGPASDEPYEHDRSGLALDPVWDEGYPVTLVAPDSPAARARIDPNDTLVSVNGRPARDLFSTDIDALLRGPAGTTVRVCTQDPSHTERCNDLRLRDLL